MYALIFKFIFVFYSFCRKGFDFQRKQYGKLKKFKTVNPEFYNEPKSKLYLKLSRKESSSTYSKGQLMSRVGASRRHSALGTLYRCGCVFSKFDYFHLVSRGPLVSPRVVKVQLLKGFLKSHFPFNNSTMMCWAVPFSVSHLSRSLQVSVEMLFQPHLLPSLFPETPIQIPPDMFL